jgi:hypothetical protein
MGGRSILWRLFPGGREIPSPLPVPSASFPGPFEPYFASFLRMARNSRRRAGLDFG